jgi:hypothetical protein
LTLQPREVLDLGVGQHLTGTVTITSDGSDPAVLTKVGLNDRAFTVGIFPPLPATLASGSTLTVSVTYTAQVPGPHDAMLELDYSGTETSLVLKARA